jgi:hypothetical protein
MPILDATAGQHLLQPSLIHGLAHDKIRHIAMPISAALKRMTASMLLTVITEAALKSPVSRISRSPGLDQPRRGEAEKMHLCAANSAGEPGTPYSAR